MISFDLASLHTQRLSACLQRVQAACLEQQSCAGVTLLPLDLCAPASQMHEAAVKADNAFDGAGVDYLVHNAGEASCLC